MMRIPWPNRELTHKSKVVKLGEANPSNATANSMWAALCKEIRGGWADTPKLPYRLDIKTHPPDSDSLSLCTLMFCVLGLSVGHIQTLSTQRWAMSSIFDDTPDYNLGDGAQCPTSGIDVN